MKAIDENDPHLKFVPIEKAAVPPPGLIEHIKDSWWAVHPTKGLVFWASSGLTSPQCNPNKATSERLWKMYPWATVEFVPSVFHRINPSDYA